MKQALKFLSLLSLILSCGFNTITGNAYVDKPIKDTIPLTGPQPLPFSSLPLYQGNMSGVRIVGISPNTFGGYTNYIFSVGDINKTRLDSLSGALNGKQNLLGFTAVPTTRKFTINGTDYYFNQDQNITIATGTGSPSYTGTINQYINGAGAYINFPTALSFFVNDQNFPNGAKYTQDSAVIKSLIGTKQDNLGFTAVPNTRTLIINGTAHNLANDASWTIAATDTTPLHGEIANLQVTKQNNLGFAPVPLTRLLTINGIAHDLTSDASWTIPVIDTTPLHGEITNLQTTKQNALGFTPVPITRTLTVQGVTYDLSQDQTIAITGTGGSTDTLPLHTEITDLQANKQNLIPYTTVPNTRKFTINGTDYPFSADQVINIPTSTPVDTTPLHSEIVNLQNTKQANLGYTPVAPTLSLTINGVTQNLGANRTWTISPTDTTALHGEITALQNGKQNLIGLGTAGQYFKGDLSLGTLSTDVYALGDPRYAALNTAYANPGFVGSLPFTKITGTASASQMGAGTQTNTYALKLVGGIPTWAKDSVNPGTVSSVGLTVPSGFSVNTNSITYTGTFNITTALSGLLYGTGTGFATATVNGPITYSNGALGFNAANLALTGTPTAPTQVASDNTTAIATDAFVKSQNYITATGVPVQSVAGKTGAVTLVVGDVSGAAPLNNATFTGVPIVPTAPVKTNSSQAASTAFVNAAMPSILTNLIGYQSTELVYTPGTTTTTTTSTGGVKYYVDAGTTGTQVGTLANPYKTLAQVVAAEGTFKPGDSIMFRTGTNYQSASNAFVISCSGNSTYPIVFCSYSPDGNTTPPYFQCAASPNTSVIDNRHVVDVSGSYVTLDGLDMIDLAMSATDHSIDARVGYGVWSTGNYNTFRHLHISRVGDCININTDTHNNTIEYCLLENGRMIVDDWAITYNDYGANGVVIEGPNNTIQHNTFKDLWANCFDFSADANPSTSTVRNGYDGGAYEMYGSNLDGNVFNYNTVINTRGFLETGNNKAGSHAANLVIAYNKLINIGTLGSLHGKYTDPVISNLQYLNNVMIEDFAQPFNFATNASFYLAFIDSAAFQPATNAVIAKNNIFYMNTGQKFTTTGGIASFKAGQFVHTNNIFKWGTGPLNFTPDATDYSTTSAMLLFNDTTSRDPSLWDYTPALASKPLDFGASVGFTTDFAGNTILNNPDAGILERSFTPPVTGQSGDVLLDGTDFVWQSDFVPPGKMVYLQVVGRGSNSTSGPQVTLYDSNNNPVAGSATISGTTTTIANSPALTLVNGTTYRVKWKTNGTGNSYIRQVRLIISTSF